MKTDRLYAITLYLLNHGKTSASKLARHFEVTVRTIQRDIDDLCQAGIPICSYAGANGGYAISDSFTMDNQLISQEDYACIVTALRGMRSASGSRRADELLEKFSALWKQNRNAAGMILDFSVLREGDEKLLQDLQAAAGRRERVRFTYTNNAGETRIHLTEPIAVVYRWYAWYLLAYCVGREDYRTYKLVRMSDLEHTGEPFHKEHASAESIMAECGRQYESGLAPVRIKLRCDGEAVHRLKEYLHGTVLETYADGSALMELCVIENEQWWIGVVLSQGAAVEILEPEHIRERVVATARELLGRYGG